MHPKVEPRIATMFFGCGAMCALYAIGDHSVSWFSSKNTPPGETSVDKAELLERHRGWVDPIEEIIAATDESLITRLDIYDRDPVERWGEGRVTLLGDAAHAMTTNLAQGACQTVEDAVVLARCLAADRDVERALRAYEARRIPRTADLVKRSRSAGQIFASENRLVYAVRTRFLRLGGYRFVQRQYVKDMSYAF
jgi:2-polyprenyl-6-methoxyphenol hydroxylase-like FAD-dependent oxidoreductase